MALSSTFEEVGILCQKGWNRGITFVPCQEQGTGVFYFLRRRKWLKKKKAKWKNLWLYQSQGDLYSQDRIFTVDWPTHGIMDRWGLNSKTMSKKLGGRNLFKSRHTMWVLMRRYL